MSEKVTCVLNVQIVGGERLSATKVMEVEAYDRLKVSVDPGTATLTVQPSAAQKILFVFITASAYPAGLKYSVSGGPADVLLDAPQLLSGSGAVAFLGSNPQEFTFTNPAGDPIVVEILVGRSAQ
jgi:hypothetical protein